MVESVRSQGVVPRPRVLIRTFAPNANPNYGGILQAWALTRVLGALGVDAMVDSTSADGTTWLSTGKSWVKRAAVSLAPARILPRDWARHVVDELTAEPVLRFANAQIPLFPLYDDDGSVSPSATDGFDGFVVGSDQVWRPDYTDLTSYLLNFLPPDDDRVRISFAVSFGNGDPEFSAERTRAARELVRRFSGISVRERVGIDLVRDLWGVDADQHVDPTLLVDRGVYAALAASAVDPLPPGRLVNYLLDSTPHTCSVVRQVANALGEESITLLPAPPMRYAQYRRDPAAFRRPTIEAWLGAIRNARFMVTDSFHGTVFSILNHTPFISVVDRSRAASRFDTLLGAFGLEDRAVAPGDTVAGELLGAEIDWERIDATLARERARAFLYLERSLTTPLLFRQRSKTEHFRR